MPDQIGVNGPGGLVPFGAPKPPVVSPSVGGSEGRSFSEFLDEKIGEVDRLQQSADQAILDLATGREQDVNKVVTAVEKANLAFQMMLQIRNKLVDAYQEIMRIRT